MEKKNNFVSFKLQGETLYINIENQINPSEKEFNELLEWYREFFTKIVNFPFCMIINIENLIMINMGYMMKWAALFKEVNDYIEKNVIATSIICSSMVAKSMMDLFFAFYTPVRPSKIFKPDEDYIKFLKDEYNKYKEN